MAVYELVAGIIENTYLGTTTIPDPILMMEVNGVAVGNSYIVQEVGQSTRFIFPRVDTAGNIYLMSLGQVYGNDLPAITISVKVYIAE